MHRPPAPGENESGEVPVHDLGELLAERRRRERARRGRLDTDLDALRTEVHHERARADALEHQIDLIHRSETWRLGRAAKGLLAPVVIARRRLRERTSTGAPIPPAAPPRHHAGEPPRASPTHRLRYEAEITGDHTTGATGPTIAFAVYTTDLDEGRGDIYVAAGIGAELARHGWARRYVPRDRWDRIPSDTDVVVAMIQTFDPLLAPAGALVVAWVRNETEMWLRHPALRAFDAVITSSEASRVAVARRYAGPTRLLPLGVDTELFSPGSGAKHGIVTTVNDWGRERQVYRALASAPVDFPLTIHGHVDVADSLVGHHRGMASYFALPAVYATANAVIDDFNHTTRPFGNVNSRLLEALACDTMVITNTATGLDALGLGEVAVYDHDDDLHDLCRRAADGAFDEPARRLGEHVRAHHSYRARAVELDAMLDDLRSERRPIDRVIGFLPDFRITNPYQDLLYRSVPRDTLLAPIGDPFDIEVLDRAAELGVPFVLHVHWTSVILGSAVDATDARDRAAAFLAELDRVVHHGGRVIWTVHNELPHECAHPDIEREMRRGIVRRCDAVHVMCDDSRAKAIADFDADPDRVVVVGMPSYLDVYPPRTRTRDEARRMVGVDDDAFVYLCLGTIRPYKGIDLLVDAFDRVHSDDQRTALVVAGRPDHPTVPDLERRCGLSAGVVTHFSEVPDDELADWFAAADAAVMPYRTGLNSSSVTLAYTMGLPVVAPMFGCIGELLDPACAVGFDPDESGSLEQALRRVRTLDPTVAAAAAARITAELAPATISTAFVSAIGITGSRP